MRLTQADWVLVALHELGGSTSPVDIEDVAVKAHNLAPELFGWRRHPELPALEAVKKALSNARQRNRERFVVASPDGHQLRLTPEGLRRARGFAGATSADAGGRLGSESALRRPIGRRLLRMERHPAFQNWLTKGLSGVDRYDLADLLDCPSSAPTNLFKERLQIAATSALNMGRESLATFFEDTLAGLDGVLSSGPNR